MNTIGGNIDNVPAQEKATLRGDDVMDRLVRNSILNEMNAASLKDLYMRAIF